MRVVLSKAVRGIAIAATAIVSTNYCVDKFTDTVKDSTNTIALPKIPRTIMTSLKPGKEAVSTSGEGKAYHLCVFVHG